MSLQWKLPNIPEEIKRNLAASTPPLLHNAFHGLSSSYLIL